MAKYLLIESRDPFECNDVAYYYNLAMSLANGDHDVTLFLVQNGVFPTRKSPRSESLADVVRAGVSVLADDFSLRERGIASEGLVAGVHAAPLDVVIDQLAEGRKAMWH